MAPALDAIRDALWALGLPPRAMDDEWGPGQVEFSFAPMSGLAAADAAVLFRSAVKQVCQRRGLLATLHGRPACRTSPPPAGTCTSRSPGAAGRPAGRRNLFASDQAPLSDLGMAYVAGLIEHAVPSLPFAAPTVNGYKRFRPYSFAPDPGAWAIENRGALVRVQGSPGDASAHVEYPDRRARRQPVPVHRPSLAAGLDGDHARAHAAPAVEADPYAAEGLTRLPTSLSAAVNALDGDAFYREAFGDTLVDYLVR